MTADTIRIVEVDLDDDAQVAFHIALADRVDPGRARTPTGLRKRVTYTTGTLLLDAVDADGRGLGVLEADTWAMFGPSELHFSIAADEDRVDVLDALLAHVVRWDALAQDASATAHQRDVGAALEAWFAGRGFEAAGTRTQTQRAVTDADAALVVELPDGFEIVSLRDRPELEAMADDLLNDTLADVPSSLHASVHARTSVRADMGVGPGDALPEPVFVVLAAGVPVAIALLLLTGETYAGHRMTGVARAWRGRGLAHALKAHSIRWAARNGVTMLRTTNDSGNAPMRAVNDAFGYELRTTMTMYRCACIGPVAGTDVS